MIFWCPKRFVFTSLFFIFYSCMVMAQEKSAEGSQPLTVTVTKRPQKSFAILGIVDAVKSPALAVRGLDSVDQIDRVLENMNIEERSSRAYTNITVRGQSSPDFYNPLVQLYVDGLPQDPALFSQILPMGLDRVEVLYGPQGTLYGRGAVGGVISLVTRQPDGRIRGEGYTDLNTKKPGAGFLFNAPLVKNALYSDAAFSLMGIRPTMKELTTGVPVGDSQNYSGRFRLRYAPPQSPWDILVSGGRMYTTSTEEYFIPQPFLQSRQAFNAPSHYTLSADLYGARISYDFGQSVLTALTGQQNRTLNRTVMGFYVPEWQKTFSQELRFTSKPQPEGLLDYTLGLYAENVDFKQSVPFYNLGTHQKLLSYAGFADLTWHITSKVDLLGGLRGDWQSAQADSLGAFLLGKQSAHFTDLSPKLGVSYTFNPSLMVYSLFSTGFKAGGFNRLPTPATIGQPYNPQNTYNYEVGLKGKFFEDAVNVSSSLYRTNTYDYQLFVGPMMGQQLKNVGTVKTLGMDAKVQWRITSALKLITSVAYNDSTFSQYQDPLGGPSIAGNTLPFVSPVTAHGELNYSRLLSRGLGTLTARAGVDFFGKIFFDPQNTVYQSGYALLNAGITWAKNDEFTLTVYGENLTNKNYAVYGFTMPAMGNFYQVGLGRTVGLRFQVSL